MKKIYYIDYISPNGHIGFNRIQIKALLNLGFTIYGVFKEGYFEKIEINNPEFINLFSIPQYLYKESNNILSRIELIRRLRLIHKYIHLDENEIIIFSSFETISLCLSPRFGNAYLINHISVADLDSKIKKYFFKNLPHSYHHVVFNDYIAKRLKKESIEPIIIPHGFLEKLPPSASDAILNKLNLQPQNYIFSPSPTSADRRYIETICNNLEFNIFLEKKRIKFVLRGDYNIIEKYKDNYVFIKNYLDYEEYLILFMNALSIILCYSDTFKYRVSAVLFESMAYNIPFLLKNNESLNYYTRFSVLGKNIIWNNLVELVKSIELITDYRKKSWYTDLSELTDPSEYWKKQLYFK